MLETSLKFIILAHNYTKKSNTFSKLFSYLLIVSCYY